MLLTPSLGFSPHQPESVYGTGTMIAIVAFLGSLFADFATYISLRLAAPGNPFPALALSLRPHSSEPWQCRNLNLLSIDYASRPRLRSRLTQGRSALPWKPWIFGHEDSHFILATHSGILSSMSSTAPYRYRFVLHAMLLYQLLCNSQASVWCFSPGNFRRRTSRLVSYYALFKCVAASEPTS